MKQNKVSRNLFLIAGIFLLSFILPVHGIAFPVCPFRWITGIECFGCGLTRSFCSLSHGEFWTALEYHPFGPVAYVFLIGMLLYILSPAVKKATDRFLSKKRHIFTSIKWSFLFLFMLFGTLRTLVVFGLL